MVLTRQVAARYTIDENEVDRGVQNKLILKCAKSYKNHTNQLAMF